MPYVNKLPLYGSRRGWALAVHLGREPRSQCLGAELLLSLLAVVLPLALSHAERVHRKEVEAIPQKVGAEDFAGTEMCE